jgi:hypothetical protein
MRALAAAARRSLPLILRHDDSHEARARSSPCECAHLEKHVLDFLSLDRSRRDAIAGCLDSRRSRLLRSA